MVFLGEIKENLSFSQVVKSQLTACTVKYFFIDLFNVYLTRLVILTVQVKKRKKKNNGAINGI